MSDVLHAGHWDRDVRPYDYAAAKQQVIRMSVVQSEAEADLRSAHRDYASKERVYRMALSKRIVTLKSKGTPATVAADIAKGEENIAELRFQRDLAAGTRDVAQQVFWKFAADRRELEQLIDWSMRVAPLGQEREPARLERPVGATA